MALVDLIDRLQATVTGGGSISNTKGQFAYLREQIEAIEREHAELKEAKSDLDQELAKIKAHLAKMQTDKRETFGFGDLDLRDRGTAEKAGGKIQSKVGDIKKVFGK